MNAFQKIVLVCVCCCGREEENNVFCAVVAFLDCHMSLPSYCMRVNPGMANRMVDSARGVLNNYLPDVYIYTDCVKGRDANK